MVKAEDLHAIRLDPGTPGRQCRGIIRGFVHLNREQKRALWPQLAEHLRALLPEVAPAARAGEPTG